MPKPPSFGGAAGGIECVQVSRQVDEVIPCGVTFSVAKVRERTALKVTGVTANNRKQAFEVRTRGGSYVLPYAAVRPSPGRDDRVTELSVDPDMDREGFVYRLASGAEGAVHIDHVLEYNRDPSHMADQLVHELTVLARLAVQESPLSTRELIRRLGTSATQFYRLLDTTNTRKSLRQLLELLGVLGCEVDVTVRYGDPRGGAARLALAPERPRPS